MEPSSDTPIIPHWLRSGLNVLLTIAAAVIYAYILGLAEVRTYLEGAPIFEENMVHAAGLLSGLVGAVVVAGFAQGHTPSPAAVSTAHPMGGMARTGWTSLQRPPRGRFKFLGLARILGFRSQQRLSARTGEAMPPSDMAPSRNTTLVMAVGIVYFVVYFVVGAGALFLTITRPTVPELVSNAGWVWLGTVLSAGYAFFALGSER